MIKDIVITKKTVILTLLGILFIFCIVSIIIWKSFTSNADRGQFGDMFGLLNALFSAFAFAGIIFTLILQRQDLELQRTELELTREELKGQKEQMQKQNENLQIQQFENTLFKLLEMHHIIVNSITSGVTSEGHPKYEGRRAFKVLFNQIQENYFGSRSNDDIWHALDHYFSNLLCMLSNIHECPGGLNVGKYINILKSQLSDQELKVMNCYYAYVRNNDFNEIVDQHDLINREYYISVISKPPPPKGKPVTVSKKNILNKIF